MRIRSEVSRFAELISKKLDELDPDRSCGYRKQSLGEILDDVDAPEGYTIHDMISCDSGIAADVLVHIATKIMMAHDNFVMDELDAAVPPKIPA